MVNWNTALLSLAPALLLITAKPAWADTGPSQPEAGSILPITSAIDRTAVERAMTDQERRRVTEDLVLQLAPHIASSPEAAKLSAALQLLLDRDAIQSRSRLDETIAELERPRADARNRGNVNALAAEVVDRAAHFAVSLGKGQYDSEDASRLLNIAKYASQLRDDRLKPSGAVSGDNAARATRYLATAYGIAAVHHGALDGDGRLIMDGVRDLTALSENFSRSAGFVIDIPGEVFAATATHSRKALDQASDTLDDLPAAMSGDSRALSRMIAGTKKLEGMLSGASYGGAMKDAMIGRLVDRIPLVRTVLNWWPDAPDAAHTATTPSAPPPNSRLVPATVDPRTYKDAQGRSVTLRHGEQSFADRVGGYTMGVPAPGKMSARQPYEAVEAPNDTSVSLGCAGVLTLEFVDNRLIDIPGPDLYIFEIGEDVESTLVEISAEGGHWLTVGPVAGATASIDIGRVAASGTGYRYVRLTDLRSACNSVNYAGADIDAVAAIGSANAALDRQ